MYHKIISNIFWLDDFEKLAKKLRKDDAPCNYYEFKFYGVL